MLAQHSHGLAPDECLFGGGVVGVDCDYASLCLRHDLLGHDYDVTVEKGYGVRDHRGQVGRASYLTYPVYGQDEQAADLGRLCRAFLIRAHVSAPSTSAVLASSTVRE